MIHKVTAFALIVSMPLITGTDWLDGFNTPNQKIQIYSDEKRQPIPVSPRTLTILYAMGHYTEANARAFIEIVYRESRFDPQATNSETGAYGLGQALPPEKMDSAGADWRYNAQTQLEWVASYIDARYGNPLNALEHHDIHGWY